MSENNVRNVKLNKQQQQQNNQSSSSSSIFEGEENKPVYDPKKDLAAAELFNVTNDLIKSLSDTAAKEYELCSELKVIFIRYLKYNDYDRYRSAISDFMSLKLRF